MFRELQGAGNDSHLTQVRYGGGPALTNSGGQLWNAGYIDSIGEPTADLRSNIAAEARAKIVYERLINLTADAGVREALGFLMTREIAHQQSFEKALYAIQPNFPPGKLAGMPEFAYTYVNTSQGEGDMRGPWNSDDNFQFVSDREKMLAMDGGSGMPEVAMTDQQRSVLMEMAKRTRSDPSITPETGTEQHHQHEADHQPAGGEVLVSLPVRFGDDFVADHEQHRPGREAQPDGQQHRVVAHHAGADQGADRFDQARCHPHRYRPAPAVACGHQRDRHHQSLGQILDGDAGGQRHAVRHARPEAHADRQPFGQVVQADGEHEQPGALEPQRRMPFRALDE